MQTTGTPIGILGRWRRRVSATQWADWRWHLRHRIRDRAGLHRHFRLTEAEQAALDRSETTPFGLTPYYADLIPADDPEDPLRKTMIPRIDELRVARWERDDPLGEEHHIAAPGLIHTYRAKALWLVTDSCATYCRFCTRSRLVGGGRLAGGRTAWDQALAYLADHDEVSDVLLSGGDPLILDTEHLHWILDRLRAIPHIQLIRIGTKIPAVLPQRITPELVRMLRRHHPLWMSLHFTHPRELTEAAAEACARLADAGIPLQAQTVLLQGVNDNAETLTKLFNGLLQFRVKPYYLHSCDVVVGSSHFKVPVEQGLELIRGLHGRISGYGVPHFMIDAPGGGGKVPVAPDARHGRDGEDLLLRTGDGRIYRYPDPPPGQRIDSDPRIP